MRRSTLLTFAAGVMVGWWAARRTPEAQPSAEQPIPAPPERPIEVAPVPAARPVANDWADEPTGQFAAPPDLPPVTTADESAMRDARSSVDARLRNLRKSRRTR